MKPQDEMNVSNRFSALIVSAIALSIATFSPTAADAKDKLIMSMVSDGSGSDLFVPCESSGLVKMIGPKIQILLKKLDGKPSGDGTLCTDDDIICVVQSDVHMNGSQHVLVSRTVLRGDLKRGNMKIKVDTCATNPALCALPALSVRTTGTSVTCFAADQDFATPIFSGGSLNSCEGVALNDFPLPTNGVIAETGMMGTCDDPA